ncbi:MAG: MFS transporter [Ardenticatenaceae bacterium]
MSKAVISGPAEKGSGRLIGMALGVRLLVDTSTQLFSPFLAIMAAGLGVDVIVMGALVSLRSAMGLASPFFGGLADRWGYRYVMRMTLLMKAIGLLIVGASSTLWLAAVGMVVMGIGSFAFVPLLQAYLSNQLPYAGRGRGLAVVEYAWALAGIIGLFSAGQLIAAFGWRAPFFVLGIGLLMAWMFLARLPVVQIEPPKPTIAPNESLAWHKQLRSYLDLGGNRLSAWGVVLVGSLQLFAANHILIIHSEWLSREYGLGAAELGTVALIIGGAFGGGSVFVSLVSDRLGKRRSVLWGTVACLLTYSALPFSNSSLEAAVASLALSLFCFELAFVSNIALLSEQLPTQRGKLFTLSAAVGLIGVTIAGLTGPWSYTNLGVWGLGPLSAATMLLSLLIIIAWVKEPSGTPYTPA